jgi:hypothetical protein
MPSILWGQTEMDLFDYSVEGSDAAVEDYIVLLINSLYINSNGTEKEQGSGNYFPRFYSVYPGMTA